MNSEKPAENPPTSANASVVPFSWEPLRVSHLKPSLTSEDLQLAAFQDLYHKFIIFGVEGSSKEIVLDTMIEACDLLLPLMYTLEQPDKATFIAKCNIPVLEHLVKQGLRLKASNGRSLAIDIVLGYINANEVSVSPQRLVNQALQTRWDNLGKILNLNNFYQDKALKAVYCPISSPTIFLLVIRWCRMQILGMSGQNKLSIKELKLRGNGIRGIVPFEKFFYYHLAKLDLRNNKIDDVNNLRYFTDFKITELWLDGNPLCETYATAEDYVRGVKNVFPHLQRLDGVLIDVEENCTPVMEAYYLGDGTRLSLVKQFVKHYFMFYDQDDRIVMNGLYDREAFFSATLGPITNTNHNQMTKAFASNRNLLKCVDYAKCHEFLLRGPEKIVAALRRQPPTYHNYQKFNIDIMHHGKDHLVLCIQGFFCYKEFPTIPLFFNRTFVIVKGDDNEYRIVNDQYHIQSKSPGMKVPENIDAMQGSFVVPKIKPNVFGPSERQQLLRFLREQTTMNEKYCRRYLDDHNWNIRAALVAFTKAYTVNNVPPEAFREIIYS